MAANEILRDGEAHIPRPAAGTAEFSVTFTLDGFAVTARFEGRADQLVVMTRRLRELGASPAPPTGMAVPAARGQVETPECPVHRRAMKLAPWGKYRCTTRLPDGSFCKERAG